MLQIVDTTLPLQPGDCFLINPYVMHTEFSSPQEPLEYIVIGLNRVVFHGPDGGHPRYVLLDDRANQRVLLPYFQDILRELSSEQPDYLEVCAGHSGRAAAQAEPPHMHECVPRGHGPDFQRMRRGQAPDRRALPGRNHPGTGWRSSRESASTTCRARSTPISASPPCSTCASGAFMRRVTCSPPPITARMPSPSCAAFPHPATFHRRSSA